MTIKNMKEQYLRAKVYAKTREEVIRIAGDILVKNKLASVAYTEAMLKNLEENGPYIVIAPGIAMPHARPEEGAVEMGICIVTLKEPVIFDHPSNDPVEIVIGLCAKNNDAHLILLSKVVALLDNSSIKNDLLKAKTEKQMFEILERNGIND